MSEVNNEKTSIPSIKVYRNELCYKSNTDDQSYGMWCPIGYDASQLFKEGAEFYEHPPKQWRNLSNDDITVIAIENQSLFQVARAIEARLKELNA